MASVNSSPVDRLRRDPLRRRRVAHLDREVLGDAVTLALPDRLPRAEGADADAPNGARNHPGSRHGGPT
ncbi:hypothetical protein ACL07V_20785 [Streptomyces sp. MB22_4]|uniref:hypothetical protein n=1 Tax=Streptomyces sp. MB22_4 TaxID=3383120 RepID=UPI0039A13853